MLGVEKIKGASKYLTGEAFRKAPPPPPSMSEVLLGIVSAAFGWIYTAAWSLSFYPQPLLNLRRRSTAGTTVAFPLLNTVGFSAYAISTLAFYFSTTVQQQYQDRHDGVANTVRVNDVAFAVHALVLSSVTLSQFWPALWGFERRVARAGSLVWLIVVMCLAAMFCWVFLALYGVRGWLWIDVVYALGYIKLFVTVIKYIPQAWTNYQRKSTVGWSISQILMDLLGGLLSIAQLVIDSSLQKDWSGLTGNPVKLGLGNISIFFDLVFMLQHYVLYRHASRVAENGTQDEAVAFTKDPENRED